MQGRNLLLVVSLLLNVILIAGLGWMSHQNQAAILQTVADCADDQIRMGEQVLADLGSGDPARVASLTNSLPWQIDAQKRVRYKIRTGDM